MARRVQRLSAKAVDSKKKLPGYYADGGGLYLQVSGSGSKSWVFCYTLAGKEREMGLGPLGTAPEYVVSLAVARAKASDCRRLLANRLDPIEARDAGRAQLALTAARSMTFSECAKAYVKAHRAGWKNAKHASQWESTLATYCEPFFGSFDAQDVDTPVVVRALEPIWTAKHETASRVRARVEHVLDWATARGYRSGENPARWRGHLDKLLAKIEKRRRVEHHRALPFDGMAVFMTALRAEEGIAARALELLILTATRTSEVIAARWPEIDLKAALWTIPAERMKAHREHRVPLQPRAVKLLQGLSELREGEFVFPGQRAGKHLSNMALLALLKRMGRDDITVHGFRSTFRDWASERTNYPREVCEMALAHAISDQVEAAYRRGDLFEKRQRLMLEWAKYCDDTRKAGEVVALKAKRAAPKK